MGPNHSPNAVRDLGQPIALSGENSLSSLSKRIGKPRAGIMRSRIITIIAVGITLGFPLGMGMGMVALLQAVADGNNTGLEVAFTLLVVFMGAMLISYVVRTTDA